MNTMINTHTTVHFIIDKNTREIDYETAFSQMKEITAKEGYFNFLLEIDDLKGWNNFSSLGFLSELKWFGLKNLRKYAIVTDIDWVENFISVGNVLTPGIPMKDFDTDEIQEAIEWLNAPTKNESHGLAIIPDKSFMHLLIYDTLTKADYDFINKKMQDYEAPFSMLIEVKDYEGLTFQAFWEDLKMGFNSFGKFKKIAAITDMRIKTLVKSADFLTPNLDLKLFSPTEREAAIDWIKNEQ